MEGDRVRQAALRVAGGERLRSFSPGTLTCPALAAQFVRQLVEGALALPEDGWPLVRRARAVARRAGRTDAHALDYEQAAHKLGCLRGGDPRPGDVLYWPDGDGGHTALYLGAVNGQGYLIETTDAPRGLAVWPGGPVRVTPCAQLPAPRTVAVVSVGEQAGWPHDRAVIPTFCREAVTPGSG